MKRSCIFVLFAVVLGCSESTEPGRMDGGGFRLPDAQVLDFGVADFGVDAGPFECSPDCVAPEICACLDRGRPVCGCFAPLGLGGYCDPDKPETCAAGTCVRAREGGQDVHICSEGAEGRPCSKTADICTTQLGCICLTNPAGSTDCRCTETFDRDLGLCDPLEPEATCNGTCIRVEGGGGRPYFRCSDGSQGEPCSPGDGSCRTSLGCTCPLMRGEPVCICSEPQSTDGAPCDPQVPGACIDPLSCQREGGFQEESTVCRGEGMGGLPCDPMNPMCPPGQQCVGLPGQATCQ